MIKAKLTSHQKFDFSLRFLENKRDIHGIHIKTRPFRLYLKQRDSSFAEIIPYVLDSISLNEFHISST